MLEVFPSPKSHVQPVGEFVLKSLKSMELLGQEEVVEAEKSATGGFPLSGGSVEDQSPLPKVPAHSLLLLEFPWS